MHACTGATECHLYVDIRKTQDVVQELRRGLCKDATMAMHRSSTDDRAYMDSLFAAGEVPKTVQHSVRLQTYFNQLDKLLECAQLLAMTSNTQSPSTHSIQMIHWNGLLPPCVEQGWYRSKTRKRC